MKIKNSKKHEEYQYLDLAREILKNGIKQTDRGTKVSDYSIFGRQSVYDLSKGFPLLTTKRVYWNGVIHELYWFFSGQTNIKYLVDRNVHIWDDYPYKIYKEKHANTGTQRSLQSQRAQRSPQKNSVVSEESSVKSVSARKILTKEEFIERIKMGSARSPFVRKWGELPRIYGEMWRKWPTRKGRTIDQLKWVIQELKEDPGAHNAIVTSWNPEYLYTMADRKDAARFPICHNMYQISNRGGKLSLILYQRSCDLFLGVPFNIASYALLALVLAKILKLTPGEFIHVYGDVHIYENHIKQMKEQLKRTPRPFPKVTIKGKLNKIEDFTPDKVVLENYNPYPSIKAELTVAGGLYQGRKKKR